MLSASSTPPCGRLWRTRDDAEGEIDEDMDATGVRGADHPEDWKYSRVGKIAPAPQ